MKGSTSVWPSSSSYACSRRSPTGAIASTWLLVFTLGAVLLYSTGRHALALLLEAATVVNLGLSVVWDQ